MSITKEEYARMNAKMTGVKGSVSRSCDTLGKRCIQLEELLNRESKEFSDKTTRKLSEDINKAKDSVDKHLQNLKSTGKNLTEVIAGMKAEDTIEKDLKKMATMVNDDIEDYISKYDKLKTEHAQTIEAADKLVSPVKETKIYQNRMQLLKTKESQIKHTEYLNQLENLMGIAKFENMTSDEMIIHIFIENADLVMSKIGIEILTSDQPSVTELRSRITTAEKAMQGTGKPDNTKHATPNLQGEITQHRGLLGKMQTLREIRSQDRTLQI